MSVDNIKARYCRYKLDIIYLDTIPYDHDRFVVFIFKNITVKYTQNNIIQLIISTNI